ncbi:MAG: glycosyltransferase [Hyphomonadaceae bacterium]|nr:glycosyltransferase [Hyphomonadaceae bacterium]
MTRTAAAPLAPDTRRRIVFVINSLGYGGAERVLANILQHSEARLSEVKLDLVLLDAEPERRAMPAFVTKHVLDARGDLFASIAGLTGKLRALAPDLVVSFLVRANVAAIVAARRLGVPCVISERMHLTRHLEGKYSWPKRAAAALPPRIAYRFADRVIAVSEGVRQNVVREFGVRPEAAVTIYNPYDLERIAREAAIAPEWTPPGDFIVAAGRLAPAKNFAALIDAYLASGLRESLVILGEGPERERLQAKIDAAGAHARIHMPGYLDNPFAVVARASFFVSASLSEGFPNAMAEAMALGVPVVATDCLSGPAELLAGIVKADSAALMEADFGILVPEHDAAELARAMRLMAAPERRARYAERARARMAAFSVQHVADEYWRVLREAMRSVRPAQGI